MLSNQLLTRQLITCLESGGPAFMAGLPKRHEPPLCQDWWTVPAGMENAVGNGGMTGWKSLPERLPMDRLTKANVDSEHVRPDRWYLPS